MATPIFETKKISIETLPEYLKAVRESFSYDLNYVAKAANMSPKFLEALEHGYYQKLPAEVYVYGFLRRLAELYKVDSDVLIEQYKKEHNIHENINKPRTAIKSFSPPKFSINPKTIGLSLLGAFIIFVLGYLFYQVHAINKAPVIQITSPAENERIKSSSLIIQGHTDVGAKLTVEGKQVLVDSDGNFKQPISIGPGEKVLTLVASNNFGKSSTKQLLIIGDFQVQDTQTVPKSAPLSMTLTISPNSTWVTIKIDDQPEQDETFLAGSTKTYDAQSKIVISTGDAGTTHIKLNGKDFGKLGRDGETLRNIVFTTDSLNIAQ